MTRGSIHEHPAAVRGRYLAASKGKRTRALDEFCRQPLASSKKPEVVHFVAELPRNPMGKVLRRELRAQIAGSAPSGR